MTFAGKVVLIAGASSGIGAATAKQFARLGATLALCGKRNMDKLKQVESECSTESNLLLLTGDLVDETKNKAIVEETIKHFGQLDVLVNSAGILRSGTIENTSLDQYDTVMNTNVRSMFQLSMLAVPHLIKTKGNIVNVSSVNGLRSFQGVLTYCMSKAAVDQFTRCTALDLASKQVRVNSVNPGVIRTNIHRKSGQSEEYAAFLKRCQLTHALGRPGEVDEVARLIVFLASDDASFITGATVPVDGGRHAMCPR
ncbi:3-oxoacyl-[acyl-carrier-protein] reductase FabG-like [Leptinotarsa decemlineata]|uniref:3-oxoacyl-[acyl-carrier-protein] reductase FabG-like n=1 Tax=Leptinotarsa decemlineata TaxID=7539 RepID=UPI003D305C9D